MARPASHDEQPERITSHPLGLSPTGENDSLTSNHHHTTSVNPWALTLAALGVVYGDIGTSPLYAIRECFHPSHGVPLTNQNVLGVLSLIFWSLFLVVSVKYLTFILRADNRGEGGIMALLALRLQDATTRFSGWRKSWVIILGLIGAALLYGDGVITPAISVLSAVEGLSVATPAFQPLVVPLTVGILIALFSVQHRGTARIGAIFGPATLIWFITISAIAIPWIVRRPDVLQAISPIHAFTFFYENGMHGFFVLSAIVLCITGAEALYADMGHFGKRPIRLGWYGIVFPALLTNYLGQGALMLEKGQSALQNPFYGLISGWLLYPLVAIATIATAIASQALISGAYSLTQQAIHLGYLPRTHIQHTSKETEGQIYISQVNRFLMVGSIGLVLIFQHSSNLAAAYGIAVTGTMLITSLLYFSVTHNNWKWPMVFSVSLLVGFLTLDLAFFFANIRKLWEGGWIPVLIAFLLFTMMTTWKRGKQEVAKALMSAAVPLDRFLAAIPLKRPARVQRTAVFMTLTENVAPPVLLHHFSHNEMLHERIILLTIVTKNVPYIEDYERVRIQEMSHGFYKVKAMYGYMENPDISEILIHCLGCGLALDINDLSFVLGRETFVTTGNSGMPVWRKKLFVFLSRNARPATDYFAIPPDQVIEIGSQIAI